ncbi:MAG: type II secretion system F family protein [Gemmatimonadota bacterium]|jgi:tight adherence protein B
MDINPTAGLTAVLVFCAVVFGTLTLALVWEVLRDWFRRREVAKRLQPIMAGEGAPVEGPEGDLLRQFDGSRGLLGALAEGVPGMAVATNLLREARVEWKPETLLLVSVGLAFGLGAAVLLVSGALLIAVPAAALGAAVPYLYLRHRRNRRLVQFEEEFPEAIDLLTRAIRAGHPLASGMQMVGDEGPPIVAEEFRQSFEEQRFGLPFSEALLGLVDRVNLVDTRIFAIAVLIQREVGGNLAEILDNLAETIRGRFYIRRQLRIYTAQGRITGYALAAIPVAVGLVIYLLQPEHIGLLFTTTIGRFMVAMALVLQLIGVLWIRKIIDIEI